VRGGLLHVPQRDPGVQRGGNERVSERVGRYDFGDPGPAGSAADDAPGAVPVHPPPVRGQEHRPYGALADGQVERPRGPRCERDGDDLVGPAGDGQGPVPALQAQVLDVGAGSLRDPQPVQGQQRDQGMLVCSAEPGGDQQRAELVAVQRDGAGLIVHPRTADVRRRELARSSSSTAYR
jgi:hypothetical protein